MFAQAYEKARQFTRPLVISKLCVNGDIEQLRQARRALSSATAEIDSVACLIDGWTPGMLMDLATFRNASRQLLAAEVALSMAASLKPHAELQRLVELIPALSPTRPGW